MTLQSKCLPLFYNAHLRAVCGVWVCELCIAFTGFPSNARDIAWSFNIKALQVKLPVHSRASIEAIMTDCCYILSPNSGQKYIEKALQSRKLTLLRVGKKAQPSHVAERNGGIWWRWMDLLIHLQRSPQEFCYSIITYKRR